MKALVTGGAGLIGSHIVDELLRKGYEVRIIDNLEEETHPFGKPAWIQKEAEFIHGSLTDETLLLKALQGVDCVFHQAAYGGFALNQSKYVHSNTIGTLNIFQTIKAQHLPIKKIVYASSQAVYGEGKYRCEEHGVQEPGFRNIDDLNKGKWEVMCPVCSENLQPMPTDEKKRLILETTYAITKQSQELIASSMGKSLKIPTVGLRYSMTYGPRQSLFNPYTGVCSIFSTRILNSLPPIVYEDGKQTRDLVFVEDVAKANVFVMEREEANNQVFNVGTGKQTTILEFVDYLCEAYNKYSMYHLSHEFRPQDVRHLFSDNSKLKGLGFEPKVNIREGIKKYASWIKTQGEVGEYFSKYKQKMEEMGIVRKRQ